MRPTLVSPVLNRSHETESWEAYRKTHLPEILRRNKNRHRFRAHAYVGMGTEPYRSPDMMPSRFPMNVPYPPFSHVSKQIAKSKLHFQA